MKLFEGFQQKNKTEEFYNDIVNKILFDTPVQFLLKYPEIQNYADVIDSTQAVKALLDQFMSVKAAGEEQLNDFLMSKTDQISMDLLKVFRKVLKMKIHQIRTRMVEKYIAMDGNILLNFNWKVNLVVSHSNNTNCMIPMCTLQLIVKVHDHPQEQRINIDLQKEELLALIDRLKRIQSAFK